MRIVERNTQFSETKRYHSQFANGGKNEINANQFDSSFVVFSSILFRLLCFFFVFNFYSPFLFVVFGLESILPPDFEYIRALIER